MGVYHQKVAEPATGIAHQVINTDYSEVAIDRMRDRFPRTETLNRTVAGNRGFFSSRLYPLAYALFTHKHQGGCLGLSHMSQGLAQGASWGGGVSSITNPQFPTPSQACAGGPPFLSPPFLTFYHLFLSMGGGWLARERAGVASQALQRLSP